MTRNKIIDNDMVLLKVILSFNSLFLWVNLVSRVTLNQVLTSIRMHSSQFLSLHMHILFSFFFHLRLLFLRDLRQMMKNEKFSLYSNILTALKIFIFRTINMLIFTNPYCSLLNLQQIYNIITQQYIRQIN